MKNLKIKINLKEIYHTLYYVIERDMGRYIT